MKEIKIITYRPEYRDAFVALNRAWIERFFKIEASDINTFAHLDTYILGGGGQIFLAVDPQGRALGCCALIAHPERGCHELAKMAVDAHCQGRGIGRMLGEALISYAREHGVKELFLEGNTHLEASIALYRKLGFQEEPMDHPAYDRCDIMMTRKL